MSKSKEKHTRITHEATSAPNRLPALSEAIGPSVRGFMLCIAPRACACAPLNLSVSLHRPVRRSREAARRT